MRILQAEQLRRHLTGTLLPAYLVAGDEPLLVLEAADELRRAAMASGVGERLVFDVMAGFSWPEWRMEVRSFGLFATRRLIELRLPTPKLSAEGSAAVLEFLSEPGEDILLVQTSDWSKAVESLSWVRAIEESGALMPIWPLKIGELPNWIRQRANKLGVNLTDDGLAELASRVEGNLLAAHQELSKLALLAPGQSIDASRLVDLVADYARYDVFALFDAVTAGRASRVRRILAGLRGEDTHPAELLGFLINQITVLAGAEVLKSRGHSLHAYWPSHRVFGPRQAAMERALGRGWAQRLAEAHRIDLVCKGRAAGDPWVEIERWLLRGSLPPARAARFAA